MARRWTERELELLRKFFPHVGDTITIEDMSAMLNRTPESIKCQATNLKLQGGYNKENINFEVLKGLEKKIEI